MKNSTIRRAFLLTTFLFFFFGKTFLTAQNIVPQPAFQMAGNGFFVFENKVELVVSSKNAQPAAELLKQQLVVFGIKIKKGKAGKVSTFPRIEITIDTALFKKEEAYGLEIVPRKMVIEAGGAAGLFYALQTLAQILPIEKMPVGEFPKIKAVKIEDAPRFGWRGLHLDCARYFMPISFLEKYIDAMAAYKLNKFHWHLTDDQGWRLEIKKWPKLTEVGAWRAGSAMQNRNGPDAKKLGHDSIRHGGFYTQVQVSQLVAYAKKRHVEIIPEIEMPGHCLAALAAYPEFSCPKNPLEVGVNRGGWEDIFCPTDQTFAFLDDVFAEVAALFPSKYIHIGGDEVQFKQWLESPFCQNLMKTEGLKKPEELQSYFIKRVEKLVEKHGKQMIGWDEILDGGLAPNATLMSWRGELGGIKAAEMGHDVIMSPAFSMYFDFYQGDPAAEPKALCCFSDLEKVYRYEPISSKISAEKVGKVLGVQANVWTEMMPTSEQVEYMTFPRAMALSEVAWSNPTRKNFDDFLKRLENQYPRLAKRGWNFRVPPPVGMESGLFLEEKVALNLSKSIENSRVEIFENEKLMPESAAISNGKEVILTLEKGQKRSFKTQTVLPDGRKSPLRTFEIERPEPPFSVMQTREFRSGLFARIWDGKYEAEQIIPKAGGNELILKNCEPPRDVFYLKNWAAQIEGFLRIDKPGIYEFSFKSPDIALVEFNGKQFFYTAIESEKQNELIVSSDYLERDLYRLKIRTADNGGSKRFVLKYKYSSETEWKTLPAEMLYHEKSAF